ncbi:MAG: transcriptional regulator [Myxococcales bacterium]|nr:transcriptional regulator [Myxococcales bacterium]
MSEQTLREAIAEALREEPRSLRDLSGLLGKSERELKSHLEHVRKSAEARGAQFVITAPTCKRCGFVFEERERASKPSRCPSCKAERIEPARFSIE